MAEIKFKYGSEANLSGVSVVDGQILFTTGADDSHKIYLDMGGKRIEMYDSLSKKVNGIETSLNELNDDLGTLSDALDGTEYDSIAELLEAIKELVGIGEGDSDESLVEQLETLKAALETVQGKVTVLEGGESTSGSIAYKIKEAIDALKTEISNTYATKAEIGTKADSETAETVYGAIAKAQKTADAAQADATQAKADAASKIASITNGDASVEVSTSEAKAATVKVKISSTPGNALSLVSDGLQVTVPEADTVNVVKKESPETGYFASYEVTVGGTKVGETINIPKDYLVKSASIKTVSDAGTPYEQAKAGDKYIDFVVNTKEGTGTEDHIYLPVNELVDVYTVENSGKNVTVAISQDNKISASVNTNGITETEIAAGAVTHAKLADDAVETNNIKAGAVTHTEIGTGEVQSGNIAASAVTTEKIANEGVTLAKLASDVTDKFAALTWEPFPTSSDPQA